MAGERQATREGLRDIALRNIAERIRAGEKVGITVRQLLRLFGRQKRGWRVVGRIEEELQEHGLGTEPSFRKPTRYEATVQFVRRATKAEIAAALAEVRQRKRARRRG